MHAHLSARLTAASLRLLLCEPASGSRNMARDEAVALLAVQPTLRVYGWERPEFTIGYATRWQQALLAAGDQPVTRRLTGGGIVAHGSDITFALVLPRSTPAAHLSPTSLYQYIHTAIQDVLGQEFGLAAAPVLEKGASSSNECFVAPVPYDLIHAGRKILGGAQRRLGHAILHQGSLRIDISPECFGRALATRLAHTSQEGDLSPQEQRLSASLESDRYSSAHWNQRR
ncbi:MAG: hypothetical protein SNJ52_01270 [Verrucomicrobiia bacterium]